VIVTPNAGSLARDGKDGFIVPIRQVDPLVEKILYFYNNREAAAEMGREARRQIEIYTWEHYERTLIDTYGRLLSNMREHPNTNPIST
jgi:glycosyltransferase involved in cell wall biosynthesis